MCSYLGTFPGALARSMIALLSERGDVVLDPFSGRGTVLLEARLLERVPLASDVNPIAVILSRGKNTQVSEGAVTAFLQTLRESYDRHTYIAEAQVQPDKIQLIFHPQTLAQLCYLRRRLIRTQTHEADFLLATLLGVMHGSERLDGSSMYASISMPNTFSMSPNYVRKFVEVKRLNRTARDVFDLLDSKTQRLFREPAPASAPGVVIAADAKSISEVPAFSGYRGKVRLVVTSPPYLDVVNYAKQNWIRDWLVESHPATKGTPAPDDNLTLQGWLDFMRRTITQLKLLLAKDGTIVLVIGDVARPRGSQLSLARALVQTLQHERQFGYIGVLDDYIGHAIKTTRIWGDTKGKATEVDRIIVLSDEPPMLRTDQLLEAIGEQNVAATALHQLDANRLAENARVLTRSSS
jgi:hypothetical protein